MYINSKVFSIIKLVAFILILICLIIVAQVWFVGESSSISTDGVESGVEAFTRFEIVTELSNSTFIRSEEQAATARAAAVAELAGQTADTASREAVVNALQGAE